MKKVSQYVLALLFLLLIAELVVFGPVEINEKKKSTLSELKFTKQIGDEPVAQAMQGVHVIESKNENKEWELWADQALSFLGRDDLILSKVKAKFFSSGGVTFDVVGDRGEVKTESKDMVVDGGVVTKSSNGYTFRTDKIEYNSQSKFLSSKTSVAVTGPRDQNGKMLLISGQQMSTDIQKGMVTINQDVQAKKVIQGGKYMAVTSERVQLLGHERTVKFLGQVIIDIDGTRISGPDATFRYEGSSGLIETIDLEGGVRVSDMNKWATSEKLSINLAKNEYTFDGQPRVVQDDDELRGDRITFLNGGKLVKVQNAKIKVSKDTLGVEKGGLKK